jgi:phosphoribosylamine--glycine ligase
MQKTVDGMKADGHEYHGVVYAGLFVNGEDVKVIEFNARFGDPECQPMMMSLEEDLLPLLQQAAAGKFTQTEIKTSSEAIATVCLASGGYPLEYQKGKEIFGLDSIGDPDVVVFHAGTKLENGKFYTNGGRVLNVTARADSMKAALNKAYSQIGEDGIHFDQMHYRTDIGFRVL